jgi:superfamily II DNA/RNA helicase
MPPEEREEIKRAFNAPPETNPVRILIATDAAREGLNFQAHRWHLFHFDVPWNPSRMEQRNGRIDRKLQPHEEVFCLYFVYVQRPEDRVLQILVRKTETIRKELGSLADVVESRLEKMLRSSIWHSRIDALSGEIETADIDPEVRTTVRDEREEARKRQQVLRHDIDELRTRLEASRTWIGLDDAHFGHALGAGLELIGAQRLRPLSAKDGGRAIRPSTATLIVTSRMTRWTRCSSSGPAPATMSPLLLLVARGMLTQSRWTRSSWR